MAGYTTGLVLEKALGDGRRASSSSRLRKAMFGLSGKLKTLDGTFELDETGAQIGEITPLGQLVAETGRQAPEFVTGLAARRRDRQADLSASVNDRAAAHRAPATGVPNAAPTRLSRACCSASISP